MALDYLQQIGSSLMHEPQQLLRIPKNIAALVFILPMILADLRLRKQSEYRLFTSKNSLLNALAYLIMGVLILYGMLNGEANNTFIYFQF